MRRIHTWSALSVLAASLAVAGCRNDARTGPEGMTADLERDLQLASTARPAPSQTISAVELNADGAPSGASRGQRAAVRTPRRAPTPSRSVKYQEVASANSPAAEHAPIAAAISTESAPAPAPIGDAVIETAHGPYLGTTAGTGSYGTGADDGSRGRGDRGRGTEGTGTGVIIRGGAAGEDHCEPRGGRTGRGMGGIGGGNIGTIIGIMGGGRRSPFPRY